MLEDDVVKVSLGWCLVATCVKCVVNCHLTCMFVVNFLQAFTCDFMRPKTMELNVYSCKIQSFFQLNELKYLLTKKHFLEN
jgi:hypothetical protein